MHRVLSFQMARGLGESSEFVTKRMCFSFLFSVGFICLLCGFLLGRFASERSIEFHAQKIRLELDGNGLKNNEHLQQYFLQKLEEPIYEIAMTNMFSEEYFGMVQIGEILSNFPIFHEVVKNNSFILATSYGSRERDRYVILSTSGNGNNVAFELIKIFSMLQENHYWKPRRTLIFCLFVGSLDICPTIISNFTRHKIVAYIALYEDNLRGYGNFISAGSDMIQSIILQEVEIIRNFNSRNNNIFDLDNQAHEQQILFPRLALDIPHAVISFTKNNNNVNGESFKSHHIPLMQLIGDTIWRLSESLVFHWNAEYFNDTVNNVLETVNVTTFLDIKDEIKENVNKLMFEVEVLNQRIDATDLSKALDTRIMNDILMDLDRSLLCPDQYFHSKTDLASFHILSKEQSPFMLSYLRDLQQCYNAAVQLLKGW